MKHFHAFWAECCGPNGELPAMFRCLVCKEVLVEPYALVGCRHSFCHDCIFSSLEKASQCPVCLLPSCPQDLRHCIQLENIIKALEIIAATIPRNGCRRNQLLALPPTVVCAADALGKLGDSEAGIGVGADAAAPLPAPVSMAPSGPSTAGPSAPRVVEHEPPQTPDAGTVRPPVSADVGGRARLSTRRKRGSNFSSPAAKRRRQLAALSPSLSSASPVVLACTPVNVKGETPLHLAAKKGNTALVQQLLNAPDCLVDVKDNAGWCPLHEASNFGHVEIASLLLTHGASVDMPGENNTTALHDAATNGHIDVIKTLLAHGAHVGTLDYFGHTALDVAANDSVATLLRSRLGQPKAVVTPPAAWLRSPRQSVRSMHSVHIAISGFLPENKTGVQEQILKLGGTFAELVSSRVTHLMVNVDAAGRGLRTFKFLEALLAGVWIVSAQWLDASLAAGGWVEPDLFEIAEDSHKYPGAPALARVNREKQLPPLFSGYEFYFMGSYLQGHTKEQLASFVAMGGGKVLLREPKIHGFPPDVTAPYHRPVLSAKATTLVIVQTLSAKSVQKRWGATVKEVSVNQLLECVARWAMHV